MSKPHAVISAQSRELDHLSYEICVSLCLVHVGELLSL